MGRVARVRGERPFPGVALLSTPGYNPPPLPGLRAVRRGLLRWYDLHRRDLPWRRTRDPYRIWISEIMLQQTRVEAVIPYYERFLAAFPTVAALACAPLDSVLKLWAGLGYYSRARNLHRAAKIVVDAQSDRRSANAESERRPARAARGLPIPDLSNTSAGAHVDDPCRGTRALNGRVAAPHVTRRASATAFGRLQTLPGIGRYTAAAIASIAFDEAVAVLDGNVQRVLARVYGVREPLKSTTSNRLLWELAERTLERGRPGDFNQAMMELGATICVPHAPRCGQCPIRRFCAAERQGLQHEIPGMPLKRLVPTVRAAAVAVWCAGRILWVQRPPRGLLGGLWELPGVALAEERTTLSALKACREFGIAAKAGAKLGTVEHVFTHRRLLLDIYGASIEKCEVPNLARHTAARWCLPHEVEELAISTLERKVWRMVCPSQ